MAEETPLAGNDIDVVSGGGTPASIRPATPNLVIPDSAAQPLSTSVPTGPSPIQPTPPAAPALRYRPGSFGEKMARAAESLGIPPGPGGWARSLVGAAQIALSGAGTAAGNIASDVQEGMKNVRPGGGPLSGALATIAAGNAREQAAKQAAQAQQQKEQERQDKLKQQDVENKRLDDEAHARNAEANARTHLVMSTINKQDVEAKNAKLAQDQADLASWEAEGIPIEKANTQGPVNEAQLAQMIAQGKANGYEYMPFASKLVDEGTDENGQPIHRFYYDVVKIPAHVPLSKDMLDRIHTIPGWEKFQPAPGSQLTGSEAHSLLAQANVLKTSRDALDAARNKANIDEFTKEQSDSAMLFMRNGDYLRYMKANAGNPVVAAQHMLQDPALQQKYGGNLMHDVAHLFASKSDPEGDDNFQKAIDKEKELQIKAMEAHIKEMEKGGYEGNYNLTGEAFLNSMPNPGERRTVQALANGRMSEQLMARFASKNPHIFDSVNSYDPKFDQGKVGGYLEAAKKFTSGKEGGSLRAAASAIESMKKLYDSTTLSLPGSQMSAAHEGYASSAATDMARFEVGGTAPDKDTIQTKRDLFDPKVPLTGGLVSNTLSRKEKIKSQMAVVKSTLDQYRQQWSDAAPSPAYMAKFPDISDEAKIQMSYVLNDGKSYVPEGSITGNGGKVFTIDQGNTWYDSTTGQKIVQAPGR